MTAIAKKNRKGKYKLAKTGPLLLIALPGIIYLLINNYLPMFGVFLAFKNFSYMRGIFGSKWCGFDNFEFLFATKDAWIMTRNTLLYNAAFIVLGTVCSIFLAILSTVPSLLTVWQRVQIPFGASSILIAVSVAIETVRQVESQLVMRNYKGFLG